MKILWSPMARKKINEILEYISQDNPNAALVLIHQIEDKVEKLTQNPVSGIVLLKF